MTDVSDAWLLERFVRNGSEDAFATLVERHIALVHSVAVRHTSDPHHAKDITQAVFIILARKAGKLGRKTVLPGWLYYTTRLTAANWQRAEARRTRREQEAFMQSTTEEPITDSLWQELRPQLDQAMAGLGTDERDALVLRFFQNQSIAEVGQSLGVAENTAQKRVGRALEKMRRFFASRGVDSTSAGIAKALSACSVQCVPVGLAKLVCSGALAKGATASASTLTLIKGALKIMAWTKVKTAIVAGAVVLFAAGTTTVALKEYAAHRAQQANPVEYNFQHTPMTLTAEQLRMALAGQWKLVGAKSIKTGKFVALDPHNQFFKTFTLTNWATTNYDSNSNLVNSAGGPYTVSGDVSTETIETATGSKRQFLGAHVPYRVRVIGKDYYQMGMGPAPAIEQQWHRVDE